MKQQQEYIVLSGTDPKDTTDERKRERESLFWLTEANDGDDFLLTDAMNCSIQWFPNASMQWDSILNSWRELEEEEWTIRTRRWLEDDGLIWLWRIKS